MTELKNYKIDFIKRTNEILEDNFESFREKDREITLLLNCLLGLIVTISENEKKEKKVFKNNIDDCFLALIPDKLGFIVNKKVETDLISEQNATLTVSIGHKKDLKGRSQLWFINKIRNCIAHQNIEAINDDGKWVGVRLWNTKNSTKDFEIIFTVKELKSFATTLSERYNKILKSSKIQNFNN